MPRDRVDGIHTFEGRVVYDRKTKNFSIRDVCRILKKAGSEAVENSTEEKHLDAYICVVKESVEMISLISNKAPDFKEMFYGYVQKLFVEYEALWNEFGGGEFGGGGASREY